MLRSILNHRHFFLAGFMLLVASLRTAAAQTSEFNYEGFLNDNGQPANGNCDFEFRLFNAAAGGAQQGETVQRLNVAVTNGEFGVTLDFGAIVFPGADRFLEIGFRPAGGGSFSTLPSREQIRSTPYSIRSASTANADNATNATNATNALLLGGIDASQYVLTSDPRMTDARNPLPNSVNYIQNRTTQQSSANFNISGNGTAGGTLSANTVNATTQYNLSGNRILTNAGTNNLFAGVGAGSITTGSNNAFFGRNAGNNDTTGNGNSFFGNGAGASNTTSSGNSFFGNNAGSSNTMGGSNTFIGNAAGNTNTTGSNNTFIGANTNLSVPGLSYATAIGAGAVANNGNQITLGRSNGSDDVYIPGGLIVEQGLEVTLGVRANGGLYLFPFLSAGSTAVCRNIAGGLGSCSSSLRYKSNVQPFSGGLDVVRRLRPIHFKWKDGGTNDVGFGAEEVEKIEPLLATYNAKGEVEGVKYGQLTTVLVNAVKEQQEQIESQKQQIQKQQEQLAGQQRQLDALKRLLCQTSSQAEICR